MVPGISPGYSIEVFDTTRDTVLVHALRGRNTQFIQTHTHVLKPIGLRFVVRPSSFGFTVEAGRILLTRLPFQLFHR